MQGRSVDEYRAPLFFAWQLTNRCDARCVGVLRGFRSRQGLGRRARRAMRRSSSPAASPSSAFPTLPSAAASLSPWRIAGTLSSCSPPPASPSSWRPTATASTRPPPIGWPALAFDCVQISVDGATAATHERLRPGSSFAARHRGHRAPGRARARPAVGVRPQPLSTSRDPRRLRPGRRHGLRGVCHRPDDAPRPRGCCLERARLRRGRLAGGAAGRCKPGRPGAKRARRCRSIPGTS